MWLHNDAPKRVVRCDVIEALSDFSEATIFHIFHHGAMSWCFMIVIYCLFCQKCQYLFYKRILVSVCLWGFIRAKSCVARCRQLCATSSCEHAARAASQPVWVKPKSFQIPVPLNLDSLDYVIICYRFLWFFQGPPISGTSETEKWDPYKIPTLKLGFPGISPFLNVSLAWMTFSHDSPTPGTIRATRCPENPRDSAIGQGVKGPIVVKLLRNRGLVPPSIRFFPAMYWVGNFWRGELDLSQICGKIHGSEKHD